MSLTASQLQSINLKAEAMWKDSQRAASMKPEAGAAVAVLEHQNARFEVLNNVDKDLTVKVTFINACGFEAADRTDDCTIDGDLASTESKTYAANISKETSFEVNESEVRTNSYSLEELVAESLSGAIKVMDEFWSRQVLAKIKTLASENPAASKVGLTYNEANNVTEGLAGTLADFAKLAKVARLNKIPQFYLIDNGVLFEPMLNAALDSGNAEGKGAAARLAQMRSIYYDDMFNFDAAGLENEDLFLVGNGSVAFKTVNKYPDMPKVYGGQVNQTRYTVPSIALPDVKYDVIYTLDCSGSEIVHKWKLITNGLLEASPTGCPQTFVNEKSDTVTFEPTGVIAFAR